MFRNYLKIAWRNIIKNRTSSLINIGGLAIGIGVAMIIGLWIQDELTFNQYHKNYQRIARVMRNETYNGTTITRDLHPILLSTELRRLYGNDFKYVTMSTGTFNLILGAGEKKIMESGNFVEPDAPRMLSLEMISGDGTDLRDQSSVLLSESTAKAFFGNADPIGKMMDIDGKMNVKVTGVYKDLPRNSAFWGIAFLGSWDQYINTNEIGRQGAWDYNSFQCFVQLADGADLEKASASIRNLEKDKLGQAADSYKPQMFLFPMSNWHLYGDFKDGVSSGERVRTIWLFGIIGGFVLIMACINFMNLATARSEKRAKEVGVRKAIGSLRSQLIKQFLWESMLIVMLAFVVAIAIALLFLPFFNSVADKKMTIPWLNPWFWLMCIGFGMFTALLAGSYPALYLSSFQAVKVLKGTFRTGHLAALPRKILVALQFTISITLIICMVIIFRQIEFAKQRSLGYDSNGLIIMGGPGPDIHMHLAAIRDDLKKEGAIIDISESHSPLTNVYLSVDGFSWSGKDPNLQANFNTIKISQGYGQTVGWQLLDGRDFSPEYLTDSMGMIVNEAAAKFMGMKKPVGEIVKAGIYTDTLQDYKIIGVVKNVLMESPYKAVKPSVYILNKKKGNFLVIKMNPEANVRHAVSSIESVIKKYSPASLFNYKFVAEEYALKFGDEVRFEKLAGFFGILAICISCLGIFGLASFMAEQRIKEIGIRKILGASVFNLWGLLSKDFAILTIISLLIASPIAYYFMYGWLQKYEYRTTISWLIFAGTGICTMIIILATVSYQTLRAVTRNPAKTLRAE